MREFAPMGEVWKDVMMSRRFPAEKDCSFMASSPLVVVSVVASVVSKVGCKQYLCITVAVDDSATESY